MIGLMKIKRLVSLVLVVLLFLIFSSPVDSPDESVKKLKSESKVVEPDLFLEVKKMVSGNASYDEIKLRLDNSKAKLIFTHVQGSLVAHDWYEIKDSGYVYIDIDVNGSVMIHMYEKDSATSKLTSPHLTKTNHFN